MDSGKWDGEYIHSNRANLNYKKKWRVKFSMSAMVLAVAGIFSHSSSPLRAETPPKTVNSIPFSPRQDKTVIEIIKSDIQQNRRAVAFVLAAIFLMSSFFFYSYMKAGIVLLALASVGAVSRAWQRFVPFEFGIELVMLATVISGVFYGAFAAVVVGFVSLVASTLLTQEDPGKMWPAFLTIAIIGFLAGTMTITNIAFWGVMLTVLYDVIISVIYISMGFSVVKTLIFDATHIAFNFFVFYHIAPLLISVLA